MKGLNKIALVAAIAAASTAQAELVAMDDAAMGVTTGQAGLTIDINAVNIDIGEIQYKDKGSIFINKMKLGGAGLVEFAAFQAATGGDLATFLASGVQSHNLALDNLSIKIDVAGADNSDISWGLNKVSNAAVLATIDGNYVDAVTGTTVAVTGSNLGDYSDAMTVDPLINDGDLVIGLDAQDQATAVDFGMIIGQVALGEQAEGVQADGSYGARSTGTVLMARTALGGGIGPVDIVIDGNNGGMNINAYFKLKGSIEMPFMATKFGFALHNKRGADRLVAEVLTDTGATYELSGAHFQGLVEADADASKGLHFVVQDFSGDMDITKITFGSAPSIGDLYITDLKVTADMNIYGH